MPSDANAELELRASYFQDFLVERIKIGDHKWIESEKAGHDIGWEKALVTWVMHHRSAWKRTRARRAD